MSHTYNFFNVSLRLILQREDRYRDISEVKQVLHYTWLAKETGKQDTAAHNRLIDNVDLPMYIYLIIHIFIFLSYLFTYTC